MAVAPFVPGTPVAFFLPDLAAGGVERRTVQLAGGIAARSFAVDVVAARATGPTLDLIPEGVRVVDLERERVAQAVAPLARYLRGRRPAVLVSAKDHANVAAYAAGVMSRTRTPIVASVRARPSDSLSRPERWTGHVVRNVLRFVYPRCAAVIAVSNGVAEDVRLVAPRTRSVEVIPNAVVSPALSLASKVEVEHPWVRDRTAPLLVWCGRLSAEKDPIATLRAFALVRARREARLVFVGDGPLEHSLRDEILQLGLASDVEMLGYVPNPAPYLAAADVFVLSSHREGLPGALIEALALGAKVVSTDCESGPREILDGGRLGTLVPIGDLDALATAIDVALDAPRRPADPSVLERYGVERAVDRHLAVFARCGVTCPLR